MFKWLTQLFPSIPEVSFKFDPPEIVSATRTPVKDFYVVIEATWDNGQVVKYHGRASLWYKLPEMTRCSEALDNELYRINRYIEYHGIEYVASEVDK